MLTWWFIREDAIKIAGTYLGVDCQCQRQDQCSIKTDEDIPLHNWYGGIKLAKSKCEHICYKQRGN